MDAGRAYCSSTTTADTSSTRLSEPKASMAGLWAVAAAYRDAPHSTSIHERVRTCSFKTLPERRTGAHTEAAFAGWGPVWTNPDISAAPEIVPHAGTTNGPERTARGIGCGKTLPC